MKILIIGDFHIPERAEKIPDWIVKLLKKEEIDLILCTGDLVDNQVLDFLKKIAPLKVVEGNMENIPLPEKELVEIENNRILLMHGTGIHPRADIEQLYEIAKENNADILVHGHTHVLRIEEKNKILFLNPGSATGCWGGSAGRVAESLIILELNNGKRKLRIFKNGKEEI